MIRRNGKSSPLEGRLSPAFSLRTDNKGTILSASPHLLKYLGKKKNQLSGLSIRELTSGIAKNRVEKIFLEKTTSTPPELKLHLPGGEKGDGVTFWCAEVTPPGKSHRQWIWHLRKPGEKIKKNNTSTFNFLLESLLRNQPFSALVCDTEFNIVNTGIDATGWLGSAPDIRAKKNFLDLVRNPALKKEAARIRLAKKTKFHWELSPESNYPNSPNIIQVNGSLVQLDGKNYWILNIERVSHDQPESKIQLSKNNPIWHSSDLLVILDKKGLFRNVSSGFSIMTGFAEKDLSGKSFYHYVHPEDIKEARICMRKLVNGTGKFRCSQRFLCKNGEYKWLSWSMNMKKNSPLVYGEARDITEAKQAEQRLLEKEEDLEMIVSSQDDVVFELDTDLRFIRLWCSNEALLIKPREEMMGRTFAEVFSESPKFRDAFLEDFRKVRQTGSLAFREFSIHIDNEVKWFNSKISPLYRKNEEIRGFSIRISDNSEKKKVELAIQEKNYQLKQALHEFEEIIENATEVIFKLDPTGLFSFVSPEFERFFGYFPNEVVGKHFSAFIHPDDLPLASRAFELAMKEKNPIRNITYRVKHKNGGYRWSNTSGKFLFDQEGNPLYGLGFSQDITELINTHEALKAAEEKYRMFIHQSSEGIWCFETPEPPSVHLSEDAMITWFMKNGVLTECNDAYASTYGFSNRDEVIGTPLASMIEGSDPRNVEFFRSFMRSGYHLKNAESVEQDASGNKKYILNNLVGIIDNDRLLRVWGTQRDISGQREIQESLKESEERFRQLADTAPVMIWVTDESDNTTYVNKSWVDFTGVSIEKFKNDIWKQLIHPDDVDRMIETYRAHFQNHLPVILEYRLKTRDGNFRWVLDNGVPRYRKDGKFLGYIGSVLDIHDRRLAEGTIRYQAEVLQNVSDAVISTDLDRKIITWNKTAELLFGFPEKDVLGKKFGEILIFNYINNDPDKAMKILEEKGYWEGEAYYERSDGKRVSLLSTVSYVINEKNEKIGLVGIHRDITDKKKSEEKLRISEVRYRSLVNAMGEGILLFSRSGELLTCNASAEKIFGFPPDTLTGTHVSEFGFQYIHEDGTVFPPGQHPVLLTLQTCQPFQEVIMGMQHDDGRLTWISINTEPIYYHVQLVKPDAVVATVVDITQKKMADLELLRSEKQLREYSDRINGILESITDGFIALDKDLNVILWNHVFEKAIGIKASDVIGKKIFDIYPAIAENSLLVSQLQEVRMENKARVVEQFSDKYNLWFEISMYPSGQGLFVYFRDISERKRQEAFLSLEKKVLEVNARQGGTLQGIVDFFLDGIGKIFPDMYCSVLTLDMDGETIHHLSGPRLPKEFNDAVEGLTIGPSAASFGAAMFRKEIVIVTDIFSDPIWADYLSLAQKHGLRSCWSFPILDANNKVLATIVCYFRQIQYINPTFRELFQRISNLLRIIIENKKSEALIRQSNERYILATMATNDAIWEWDVNGNTLVWGEGIYNLFGYSAGIYPGKIQFWESRIHPQDRARVAEGLNRFFSVRQAQYWEEEYRFKRADGKYVLVHDRGFLIYNQHGKINRMVGSMQDITEKREMEKKLLKQELDKQKLVAQAVVEAQEKERALIGKELHDNVNQILSTAKLYLELATSDEKERLGMIEMSTGNISEAINEIRSISRSLVPSSIDDLGLVDSLADLIESIRSTRKLHIEFYHQGPIDEFLGEQQKLMLYRISQEQINNVLKHAEARNLIVELVAEENRICLSIQDDGKGFEYEKIKGKKGIGLANIISRVDLFNGKVNMITAPGKGCTLQVTIPISNT